VERDKLLALIKEADEPIPGAVLAARLGVSRQAVVHHIAVLRAAGLPIEATIRGYVWRAHQGLRDVFMVRHRPEETADELFALVDAGDVQQFLDALALTGGTLLSTLTDGVHWHTVEGRDAAAIARGRKALERLGFWLDHSPSKSPTPR
jgi:transcriptional regulator of NAD metabolism